MLMLILAEAGLAPSFVVGGDVTDAGTGAHWTGGEWLVVEADESDGTHLELPLHGTILTNVEVDYLEHYGTFEALVDELRPLPRPDRRARRCCAPTTRVCAELAARHDATTYGLAERQPTSAPSTCAPAAVRSASPSSRRGRPRSARSGLPLRGVHNVVNATGAIAMATALGVPFDDVRRRRSARFGGVARRFDIRGVDGGATFVDDYAHLPAEIAAVIAAARDSGDGWRRVIVAFQPNRFNRIAEMWRELRRRLRRRRRRRAHRHLPVGHDADPGRHRRADRQRRARRPSRAHGSSGCRGARTWCRSWPARSGRATCASRWAAATSPRCPRRSSPAAADAEVAVTHRPTSARVDVAARRARAAAPRVTSRWRR